MPGTDLIRPKQAPELHQRPASTSMPLVHTEEVTDHTAALGRFRLSAQLVGDATGCLGTSATTAKTAAMVADLFAAWTVTKLISVDAGIVSPRYCTSVPAETGIIRSEATMTDDILRDRAGRQISWDQFET